MIYKTSLMRGAYICLAIPLLLQAGTCQAHIFSFLGTDTPSASCDVPCDSLYGHRLSGRAFLLKYPRQHPYNLRLNLADKLMTDRPSFTESSRPVGRGVAQIESGYTYWTDDDIAGNSDYHTFPELLLRYGFFRDWLELRLGYTAVSGDIDGASVSGSEDLYLGMKIGLTAQHGYFPEMSLQPQMTVPTGASGLTADTTLFGLNWLYGWDLNCTTRLAGSTQFNRDIDDVTANQYNRWAQSVALHKEFTRSFTAYSEWFAFFPEGSDTNSAEHYFNGGFKKFFSNNVQWDVRVGAGLNDAADDFFVGTGLSLRYL